MVKYQCQGQVETLQLRHTTLTYHSEVPFANTKEFSQRIVDTLLTDSMIQYASIIRSGMRQMFEDLFNETSQLWENKELIEWIKKENFHFSVVDPTNTASYSIPYSLDIPYASFSIGIASVSTYRVPRLSSFNPVPGCSDKMTFKQRLMTFIMDFLIPQTFIDIRDFMEKHVPCKPPLDMLGLLQKSSLWLYLEELAIGYPQPNMPNTVSIGDIMAQPATDLPSDLEQFLKQSPEDVIIVSFGSYFDYNPEAIARKFCHAFQKVNYQIIWKLKFPEFCPNVKNVKMMLWIPQNDLLAHSKVKLFITHGGFNSMLESIYHAKPVIVFPVVFDQKTHGVVAETRGFGIQMDLINFTEEDLVHNIKKVLSDKKFEEKAKLSSEIMKDKADSPAERASFLIEHVIKYGDSHLRTGGFDLSTAQFIMFDIFIFIVMLFLFVLAPIILLTYLLYKCVWTLFRKLTYKKKTE